MEHLCIIRYKYIYYSDREKVMESCRLLNARIIKYCTGHGSLRFNTNDDSDYVEAELKTQEDDIGDVLKEVTKDLPEGCMREDLEGYYSYTKRTRRHHLLITLSNKCRYVDEPEKDETGEEIPWEDITDSTSRFPDGCPLFPKSIIAGMLMNAINCHTRHNSEEIKQSKQCGCSYCWRIFPPSAVTAYDPNEDDTALCPYCHSDSVIGDASGYKITRRFLWKVYNRKL